MDESLHWMALLADDLTWSARTAKQLCALAVIAALFAAVRLILRRRGPRLVLSACLFVAALCSTQLLMSVLGRTYNYRFPGLVTVLHFASVSLVCFAYWAWHRDLRRCLPCSIGARRYCSRVIPAALSQPVAVVFNNKAMVFVGAGLVAIIGTLAPVACAVLSRALGRKLALLSWVGVFVAFGGALVISWGELEAVAGLERNKLATAKGLLFAFASIFGRCLKIVILDLLLAPSAYRQQAATVQVEEEEPLSLMHVFALTYPMGAAFSLAYALTTESLLEAWEQLTPRITCVVLSTCASALALNFLGGAVLKDLGASAQQLIGKLNTICIAALSVAFLGEEIPAPAIVGGCFVLGGVALFEQGERTPLEKEEGEDDDEEDDEDGEDTDEDESEEEEKAYGAKGKELSP